MDDTDRTTLDTFDRRLDPLVPTAPAPVTDLVRRGRARRRRRQGLGAGLAAAVAVAAIATGIAVVDGPSPASAPPTPPAVAVPDGQRLVGLGDVAVAVPDTWVLRKPCGLDLDALTFGPPDRPCGTPYVQLGPIGSTDPADPADSTGTARTQHGLDVVRTEFVCGPGDDCVLAESTTVAVPDADVRVVTAGDAADRAVRAEVAASVQPMPDAQAAVPPVADLTPDEAVQAIRETGLTTTDTTTSVTVLGTLPEVGSVVVDGSNVSILGPTEEAIDKPRTVTYGGLSFEVPHTWVDDDECLITNPGEPTAIGLRDPVVGGQCGQRVLVHAYALSSAVGRSADELATHRQSQAGLDLRVGSSCSPTAACIFAFGRYVVVPQHDVVLLVSGPVEARPVLDAVIASIQPVASTGVALEPGTRLVGLDGVAVAIPSDWVPCPIRTGLSFGPPDADGGCDSPDGALDVVTLTRIPDGYAPAEIDQGGLALAVEDGCGPAASCVNPLNRAALAVDEGVRVFVGSSSDTLAAAVIGSVRAMPVGQVAVPLVREGAADAGVISTLEGAGLVGLTPEVEFPHYVIGTTPPAGTVVPVGTEVELQVGDG